jgi:geranylgeranyl diphosphate synthase type I
MDAVNELKKYKLEIDNRLVRYLDNKINKGIEISPNLKELIESIKDFNVRGGKRLRPALVVVGYKCVNNKDINPVLNASLALEIAHAHFLIHDDIYDEDDLRRGKPTLHKTFREQCSEKFGMAGSQRFGESQAIIAGNITETLCHEVLLDSDFPENIKIRALRKIIEILRNTNYGQSLDIINEKTPLDKIKEEDVFKVHELKTAKYTIEGPLHLGVILGGGTEKDMKIMTNYAIPLGIAFQIQDDILGMFGDEKKLGKPIGSDLKEGKRTLLILKALENGTEEQKKIIIENLGKKNLSLKDIERVRKVIIDTDSLAYSKELARKLVKKVKAPIGNSKFNKEGKDFLIGIADYLIEREI